MVNSFDHPPYNRRARFIFSKTRILLIGFFFYFRFVKRKDVYVLPHLYGELARHRNGIDVLEEEVSTHNFSFFATKQLRYVVLL